MDKREEIKQVGWHFEWFFMYVTWRWVATPWRSVEREMDYQRGGLHLIYMLPPLQQHQLMENVRGSWQMQRVQGKCLPLGLCSCVPDSTGGEAHYAPLLLWILKPFLLKLIASGSVICNQCDWKSMKAITNAWLPSINSRKETHHSLEHSGSQRILWVQMHGSMSITGWRQSCGAEEVLGW